MRFGCKGRQKARETEGPTVGGDIFWKGHFKAGNVFGFKLE